MNIYLSESLGILTGPVQLPVVPGLGAQMPGNAIELADPLPAPKKGYVWVLLAGVPQQVIDHRGTVYRVDTGSEEHYTLLGELPPEFTLIPKPSPSHHWQNGAWVQDLGFFLEQQTAMVNSACVAAITGGFWSSALGAPHQYGSELDDQLNLTGVILRGFDSPYACRDVEGRKEFRAHTVIQLRQVGDDFTDYKLQLLQQANRLKQQLDQALAADDLAALEAVTWKDPQP
jgi:hypothetical protein